MGCYGSKEASTLEKGRADSGAVVPAAVNQAAEPAAPVMPPTDPEQAAKLKTTTPALSASFEPPLLRPTEEQAAKRAARLERLAALPEHLRLGITLAGMRNLLDELPSDALEQVNSNLEQVNAKLVAKGKDPRSPRTSPSTATPTSSGSRSGPRRPRRASQRATGWPCASGCGRRSRRTWARPPCS